MTYELNGLALALLPLMAVVAILADHWLYRTWCFRKHGLFEGETTPILPPWCACDPHRPLQ